MSSPGRVPLDASLLLSLFLSILAAESSFVVAYLLRMGNRWFGSSGEGPCWSPLGFPAADRHSLRLDAEGGFYVYVFWFDFECGISPSWDVFEVL